LCGQFGHNYFNCGQFGHNYFNSSLSLFFIKNYKNIVKDNNNCRKKRMDILNFFPKYPNIYQKPEDLDLLNPYSEDFNNVIISKKEFTDLQLEKSEQIQIGDKYKHQHLISRFLASVTPYNELLLFHEMGTGKTCTAITTIEKLKKSVNPPNHAYIFAKGDGLLKNFLQELLFTCTDGQYIPDGYNTLTDGEKVRRVNKLVSKYYSFWTFEKFARKIASISDYKLRNEYSNSVLILDEVHNLREKENKSKNIDNEDEDDLNLLFTHDGVERSEFSDDSTQRPSSNTSHHSRMTNISPHSAAESNITQSGAQVRPKRSTRKKGENTPSGTRSKIEKLKERNLLVEQMRVVKARAIGNKPKVDIYKQFHRFLHVVKHCKILLMSGTVMKDNPSEFASIMNLILPENAQFELDKTFLSTYFGGPENRLFKREMVNSFKQKIKGRISYLKSMTSDVKKVFIGDKVGNLEHFIVYVDIMSDFQTKSYMTAYTKDMNDSEKSFYSHSRQAILFVYPDGTYGPAGFNQTQYITQRKIPTATSGKYQTKYSLGSKLIDEINKKSENMENLGEYSAVERSENTKLENLGKYSSKYKQTIEIILKNKNKKSLVFCEYVLGSGAILFAKLLDQFGFYQATGHDKIKTPRYALLTNHTTTQKQIQLLINRFNNRDNAEGEYISVIIGSRVISEGFTFKNITQEFILTPHWNYSETAQVIARGWRLGSHDILKKKKELRGSTEDITVSVYQQVSLPNNKNNQLSIDLQMYETGEKKDILMKQIEHIVKESSFDCPLTIARNTIIGYNGMRECEYMNCIYSCDAEMPPQISAQRSNASILTPLIPTDKLTYNLYYAPLKPIQIFLNNYFRTHFYIFFTTLLENVSYLSDFEVIQGIKLLIDKDIQFINKFGFPTYLRIQNNILYISPDPKISNNNKLAEYYSKNLIIKNGDPFAQIVQDLYFQQLPKKIKYIFSTPDYYRSIIGTLPELVQRVLLQGCIQADQKQLNKNKNTRKLILAYFKGFYDKIKYTHSVASDQVPVEHKIWVVWLYEDFGITCLYNNKWIYCKDLDNNIENIIHTHRTNIHQKFLKSPIGYYGLYNPQLNDFCLRHVDDETAQTDFRKITVGRRCVDWDLNPLLDIVVRRMKLEPLEPNFLRNRDKHYLKAQVELSKYKQLPADILNNTTMKRFLYWQNQNRRTICENIREWLKDNDLIEQNFNCGHQKKHRVK